MHYYQLVDATRIPGIPGVIFTKTAVPVADAETVMFPPLSTSYSIPALQNNLYVQL